MAIDKGSLDYRIRVTDQLSAPIAKFRAELLKARNTALAVKQEIGAANAAISRFGVTSAKAGAATRRLTEEERAKWKAVREGAQTATIKERLRARALKDLNKENLRLAKKAADEAKKEARATQTAAKARERASKAAATASRRALANQRRLNRELTKTQKQGSRLVFTFKRLVTVVVGLQAIRFGVNALRESITAGIRFNATIETARIGMAGLFATLQNVRDIQTGELLTGAEAFAATLAIADGTLEQIRQRSLATAATFPELAAAFRAGFAPGISAGLNTDEIIEVTERVSQVLTGLGIAQNQINEEIRSLLLGTATSRTSLVATLFFGGAANANKSIKDAKEIGNVFKVITERLKAFQIAAGESQKTFTGTVARVKGLLEVVAGRASLGFLQSLKDILGDIQEVAGTATIETNGFITSIKENAGAITVLKIVFDTLANITTQARAFLTSLTTSEIASFLLVLGASVEVMAALFLGALEGVIRGVALIGALFNALGVSLSGLDLGGLTELAALISTIAVVAAIVKVTILAWSGVLKIAAIAASPVFFAFTNILTVAGFVLKTIAKIPAVIFPALGIVLGLTLGFLALAEVITGISLDITDLPEVIGLTFEQVLTRLIGFAGVIATTISVKVRQTFNALVTAAGNAFAELKQLLDFNLSASDELAGLKKAELAQKIRLANKKLSEDNKQLELEVVEAKTIGDEIDKNAIARGGERLAKLETEVAAREKAAAAAKKLAEELAKANVDTKSLLEKLIAPLNDLFTGTIGDDILDTQGFTAGIIEAFEKARAALEDKPLTLQVKTLTEQIEDAFKTMADEYANTIAIMKGLTSQFANFASTEIAIALDPNEDPDGPSANERFKTFLDQIGKLIIQKLVELAIAKTILKIASFSGGGPVEGKARGGPIGFDEGGTVPGGRHEARAYQPAQVAGSDTVPAWLTPGEFVNPVRSVMKYGADLFEGLRTGALDPVALREAAGLTARRKNVRRCGNARGFAEGGPIGAFASEGRATIQQQENTATSGAGVGAPTLMVSDEQMMDRLLAGGQRQLRNWMENEKEFFRGIVRE